MSLLKLPFILSSAIGINVAYTPPNAPPGKDEMLKPSFREVCLNNATGTLTIVLKTTFWLATLGQAATIILPLVPPSQLPEVASTLLDALGGPDKSSVSPAFLVGSTLVSLGGLLRWQCYRALGRLFTFQLSVRKDHRLVKDGPYSFVRHPSYSAIALSFVGVITMYASPGSWLRESGLLDNRIIGRVAWAWATFMGLTTISLFRRCPKEDQMMKKEFGREWDEWSSRVKYWVIPGIY
ncbi:hypothetical protein SERLADRAFT_479650 [Serpula lacrymans var. lacrymans S7.9]|uniref:Protein-S-isoprenylcysteine O-methyltransferase n=1 Tax=Serpula lacrymans var. lacrymans (strain S7.9) TaxID=578457 RepID=F8PC65_SERL9|nr:uncharacterized protein SERLADRAFT_479650 [Serpula lacrymans var. lacrymans S7.9]EGO19265.1 hypothetical protein SERLADRAFT_479650 [Serpula lacrymans var. lacrymans S7.9]